MANEYEDLIRNLTSQFAKKRSAAEAGAIGEAGRRGVIGSDLETGLRQARTEPIEQAESSTIADLLARLQDQKREERMIGEGRAYGTSEREAGQRYGTSERLDSQLYGTQERLGSQGFQSGEAEKQGIRELTYIDRQPKPKKKFWYQSAAEGLSGAVGTAAGTWAGRSLPVGN